MLSVRTAVNARPLGAGLAAGRRFSNSSRRLPISHFRREKSKPDQAESHDFEPLYGSAETLSPLPREKFPEKSRNPAFVKREIEDMLNFNNAPRLNMATFLTTFAEPECRDLIEDTLEINHADLNLYPSSREVEQRSLHMLMDLFNHPLDRPQDQLSDEQQSLVGLSTIGSTEAIFLRVINFKLHWRDRMRAKGKDASRPNLVIGANAHVAVKRACCFFEIEVREVPFSIDDPVFSPSNCKLREMKDQLLDENTIGLVAVLGSTYTGHFDPVQELHEVLQDVNRDKGLEIGMHVDAASGGFVAPFAFPSTVWDFRLPLVQSINVSGHKYGLAFPGLGWLVLREPKPHPDLQSKLAYLGSTQQTWSINFSKPSSQVYMQYFQFLRLGREGYSKILRNCFTVAKMLEEEIEGMGRFRILSARHEASDDGASSGDGSHAASHVHGPPRLPVVSFSLKASDAGLQDLPYTEFDLMNALHNKGWVVPAFFIPAAEGQVRAMRTVVKEGLSMDLALRLVADLREAVDSLESKDAQRAERERHKHHETRKNSHAYMC